MSQRVWFNLPEEFRASDNPDDTFLLYRGAHLGKHITGMHCSLSPDIDPDDFVFQSLFKKYPNIKTLVKRHTQNSYCSPFISLTDQLELAQRFATGSNETIYQIQLPAHRLVVDRPSSYETKLVESLAIGTIEPEDIVSVRVSGSSQEIVWDNSRSWV